MKPSPKGASAGEELLLSSRYIRDTLVPLLAKQPKLSHADSLCLRSIFKTLDVTPMTVDLLRRSRIHKALLVIAATGDASWPMDILVRAEELIAKWEDELGPLKHLRADLYGPGGRMEGVRKMTWKGGPVPDDEAKSAWSVEGAPKPSRAYAFGHLGFDVGDWWLKPAAAYRDGIIDETAHGITADEHGAYAIVLTGSCETDLGRERDIRYMAAVDDPGVWRLTKTMLREDAEEKVVRVLRSWRLRSKIAPRAGLRYDGLYRVTSFSVHLSPPNTWHTAFTLSRIDAQPSLLPALHIPTSDQLDDWRDYQRLKLIDRGDDFAMLHEMLAQPVETPDEVGGGGAYNLKDGRQGSEDSGYFSRRGSKATTSSGDGGKRDSVLTDAMEDIAEDYEGGGAEEADDEGADLEEPDDLEESDRDRIMKEQQHLDHQNRTGGLGKSNRIITSPAQSTPLLQQTKTQTQTEHPTSHIHPHPHTHADIRIGNRFISPAPQKPASPRLSADEAVFANVKDGEGPAVRDRAG